MQRFAQTKLLSKQIILGDLQCEVFASVSHFVLSFILVQFKLEFRKSVVNLLLAFASGKKLELDCFESILGLFELVNKVLVLLFCLLMDSL